MNTSRNIKILSISLITSSALIAGGIAYAAGDTITACVKKSNGVTRIISGKMKCTKTERTVTWGSAGEQGPAGATGSAGANGVSNVYEKIGVPTNVAYNAAITVMSVQVPAGKYNFQFNGDVGYFNNSTATLKTRFMPCLITTHSDAATSFSGNNSEVLWPDAGTGQMVRTSFPAAEASANLVGLQTYNLAGTLNFISDTTIYLQCKNESQSGDTPSAGQLAKFEHIRVVLVKTDAITALN